MTKKSNITAFSLSRESIDKLKTIQARLQKNRSETIRELINNYPKSREKTAFVKESPSSFTLNSDEENKILKYYYRLISEQKPQKTIVVALGIITKSKSVLIGLKKNSDKYLKNLSWRFPGGQVKTLNFETELIEIISRQTGFKTKPAYFVHARIIPDQTSKGIRIVAIYFHCKATTGKLKPGPGFKELKWVPVSDVTKYFTTSVSDEIMKFLTGVS